MVPGRIGDSALRIEKQRTEEALDRAERGEEAAEEARQRAVTAKRAADELITYMQYDLGDTLGKLGQLRMMEGINTRIRRYYEEHPPEPGDEDARDAADREHSVALDEQGDILHDQGRLAEALRVFRDSLEIRERLAKKYPDNDFLQSDLSRSYSRVGHILHHQGQLAEALKYHRAALEIDQRLAKKYPDEADLQSHLSYSYDTIGEVLKAQGDLSGALKSCRDGLGIREKLTKQDPDNATGRAISRGAT